MKGKYFIILALLVLLVFTIYKMMKYEESIREERIITRYIEDDSKALIEKLPFEQLREAAIQSEYNFKTGNTYFQKIIKNNGEENSEYFENFFLKGVNFGVAVPGKFPAEFSLTFDEYLNWIQQIGEMNANVIRTYTILPPDFYKALSYYNLHNADKTVYLMQGIWATVPEESDYFDKNYTRKFQKEIIDVIDVIHGKAVLKEKPGKASGIYSTDISKHVVAFLLGREWEPKSAYKTIRKNKIDHFIGSFISIQNANSMEVWLAQQLDFTAFYETQTYHRQHPISFVNWLPLDPMYHYTEFIENKKVREYDNDLIAVDFRKFNTTNLLHTGIYAAYHAYPYYPDFIYLQDDYKNAINHFGKKDNFFGYLNDLKQHTKGMPLVIAEYGLPTSRGISHFTPSGFNQGGHSEKAQAGLSLVLTEDILESGCAGAIYFEWADEWFKHNWLVMDFETPFNNRKLWHNMENPEQNFGILALEDRSKIIDASLDDWKIEKDNSIQLVADVDATYFYIAGQLPDFDFKNNNLYIAIDTYDKEKGDHKLPFSDKIHETGFEFLIAFKSTDNAKILVDEPYSVFTDIYNDNIPVYSSQKNRNGKFIDELMLVNRGRETLMGNKSDSLVNNRSPLVSGISSNAGFSNADWYWHDKTLELRLDWHLLNVSDPSHRFVLDDKEGTKTIEYSKTEGFNIHLFITGKDDKIIKQLPSGQPYFFTWDEWEQPQFTQRMKPIYDTLKNYFNTVKIKDVENLDFENIKESFVITDFYRDKQAAVSISFDNGGYSQYQYAFPELTKYGMKACFSVIPELADEISGKYEFDEGIQLKRMGLKEIKEIKNYDNEIALQIEGQTFESKWANEFSTKVLHLHNAQKTPNIPNRILFVRREDKNKFSDFTYKKVPYSIAKTNISQIELDSILKENLNSWTIFTYHNIYKTSNEIQKLDTNIINSHFVDLEHFKKQIRLIRNSNYWIDTESAIFKYITERRQAKITTKKFGDITFLQITGIANPVKYNHPLTVKYKTSAAMIKITGSATDGVFNNRTGEILFEVYPGKEVRIDVVAQ